MVRTRRSRQQSSAASWYVSVVLHRSHGRLPVPDQPQHAANGWLEVLAVDLEQLCRDDELDCFDGIAHCTAVQQVSHQRNSRLHTLDE